MDVKQGEVRRRLGRHDVSADGRAIGELDGDLVHRLHDVGGRDHVARGADHDAGADLREVGEATSVDADVTAPAANHHHAGAHLVEDAAYIGRGDRRGQDPEDDADGHQRSSFQRHRYRLPFVLCEWAWSTRRW